MFAILNKLFGGQPAKARKLAAGFRPALEALESRDLMSVAGYSAVGMKDFFIDPATSTLKERDQNSGVRSLTASASQVSVLQGDGQAPSALARADVLMQNGDLKQWDDATASFKPIASGVQQVSAGWDGYSAVLYTNGNLSLYNTDTNAWSNGIMSNVASASIGLGHNGLPMVDLVTASGYGYEWRAAGGLESLGAGVKQISAGWSDSHSLVLKTDGSVWDHYDAAYTGSGAFTGVGTSTLITVGPTWEPVTAASVSCGLDIQGNIMLVVVTPGGSAFERISSSGYWQEIARNVAEADAGSAGTTELVANAGGSLSRQNLPSDERWFSSGVIIGRYNDNHGSGVSGDWDTFTPLLAPSATNRNFLG